MLSSELRHLLRGKGGSGLNFQGIGETWLVSEMTLSCCFSRVGMMCIVLSRSLPNLSLCVGR